MIKILFNVIVCVLCTIGVHAQNGKLLILGGGFENDGEQSWAARAIRWGVTQSANKSVLIISQPGGSGGGLRSYMLANVSEIESVSTITITESNADLQSTKDLILAHDMIYFRGGDQYNYYSIYNNTLTEEAVIEKFNEGGVISGTSAGLHILSGVIFTAEQGTVFPSTVINDVSASSIKLANDFLSLFPGYLFDSHFVERGRFGRLIPFLGRWYQDEGEIIHGVGVDDKTALAIDENNQGTVFGTGAVNIYINKSSEPFSFNGDQLIAPSIALHQLLDGWQFDFNTNTVSSSSGATELQTSPFEGPAGTIFLTAASDVSSNFDFNSEFVRRTGDRSDNIMIITGSNANTASNYKSNFESLGAETVTIIEGISGNGSSTLNDIIQATNKFVFVNNELSDLRAFLTNDESGQLIQNKLSNHISAFLGRDSRFVGEVVITDQVYTQSSLANSGSLSAAEGLNLLPGTVIINETFLDSDFYENMSASVPYFMVAEALNFGMWLNGSTFAKYSGSEGEATLYSEGSHPIMLLRNDGTKGSLANTTATGTGSQIRNVGGFEEMEFSLLDETVYSLGSVVTSTTGLAGSSAEIMVYPNPAEDIIRLDLPFSTTANIYASTGEFLTSISLFSGLNQVDISQLSKGLYYLSIKLQDETITQRLIKK